MDKKHLNPQFVSNILFSVLQTVLLLNCAWIYVKGIKKYTKAKLYSKPYLIGIGGNSGVGKTTLTEALSGVFNEKNITTIRGDDMHKWERGHEKWDSYTHLNPLANHLHKEAIYLRSLSQEKTIQRRHYDHSDGRFTKNEDIVARKVVIFEGLHPFYIRKVRELYDLRIFISPDKDLVFHWKVIRDMNKRGYSKKDVLKQIKTRELDSEKYIDPQMKYADLLVEILPVIPIKNIGDESEDIQLYLRVRIDNSIYLEPFIESLKGIEGLEVDHYFGECEGQFIEFKGDLDGKDLSRISSELVPGLDEVVGAESKWMDGLLGVLSMLITFYIFEDLENA